MKPSFTFTTPSSLGEPRTHERDFGPTHVVLPLTNKESEDAAHTSAGLFAYALGTGNHRVGNDVSGFALLALGHGAEDSDISGHDDDCLWRLPLFPDTRRRDCNVHVADGLRPVHLGDLARRLDYVPHSHGGGVLEVLLHEDRARAGEALGHQRVEGAGLDAAVDDEAAEDGGFGVFCGGGSEVTGKT